MLQGEKMNKNILISQIGEKYNLNKIKNNSINDILKNKLEDKSENNQDSLINFIFNDPSEKHISFDSPETNHITPTFYYYNETKQCIE